jgi:hypothetical protein
MTRLSAVLLFGIAMLLTVPLLSCRHGTKPQREERPTSYNLHGWISRPLGDAELLIGIWLDHRHTGAMAVEFYVDGRTAIITEDAWEMSSFPTHVEWQMVRQPELRSRFAGIPDERSTFLVNVTACTYLIPSLTVKGEQMPEIRFGLKSNPFTILADQNAARQFAQQNEVPARPELRRSDPYD